MQTATKPSDADECASIWFLKLEAARERGCRTSERMARAKLKELGVTVQFRKAVAS